ncbi:prostatic acid phosphatase-like isoform X2 [Actinia tenebrosa]|uniref:acid phosphatase n=1 Tax=Actinia tenebrosa TaxID=6105 RepID=A0A6P8IE27_ACTTE|nr:prostatic acid phosphatase-like isoform X2 [Actinia tenebrosa]
MGSARSFRYFTSTAPLLTAFWSRWFCLFAAAITLLSTTALTSGLELQQVVIISRHGSRGFLTKDHTTLQETADSPLTIRGMDQMYRAGQYVRQLYNSTTTSFLSEGYNGSEVYVRSSDYQRTLISAQSFLLGLYPPREQTLTNYAGVFKAPYDIQQVPIHTVPVREDQLLRGWLRCPTIQNRISEFYKSETFKKKERDNADFLKTLESITGMSDIDLKDFYNVYDFIHLHRVYGKMYLNLTEEQWNKVVDLADWLEYHKYKKEMVESMGAGLLVNDIAQNFINTTKNRRKAKLLYYSAHYPTIVSLFSVLGVNQINKTLQTIPYYASLVFIELLKGDNQDYYVRLAFRNGLENDTKDSFQYYAIPGCDRKACPLKTFNKLLGSLEVRNIEAWCQMCNNNDLDACEVGYVYKRKLAMTAVGGFFVRVFVTTIATILMVGCWFFCLKKRCLPGDNYRPRRGLPDLEHRGPLAGSI